MTPGGAASPGGAGSPGASGVGPSTAAVVTPTAMGPDTPPLRLLVYGDSITRGGGADLVVGKAPNTSWLAHLGSGMRWVGGNARNGATAAELNAMRAPTPASDLVVYFLGTNDLLKKRTVATMVQQIRTFQYSLPSATRPRVATFVAVGPMNGVLSGARLQAWNTDLSKAAAAVGWGYIDPWPILRVASTGTGYGQWARNDQRVDNLHPSAAGAADLGAGMTAALLAQARKRAAAAAPAAGQFEGLGLLGGPTAVG